MIRTSVGRASRGPGLALTVLLAACKPAAAPAPVTSAAAAEREGALRQVRYAFRADGTEFSASDPTHSVRVDRAGAFRIEARRPGAGAGGPAKTAAKAVAFETVRAGRDGGGVAGPPALSVAPDGSMRVDRGETVEVLRGGAGAVEQAWRFAAAPRGRGDLVVQVRASRPPVAETASGLHFLDRSGLGVRYGHGTWIDAAGTRTPVPARWQGGAIALVVPATVLAASRYPAVLDPVILPEHGVDEPIWNRVVGAQTAPVVASDGAGYLAVWVDARAGGTSTDVWGARLYADGTLVDAKNLRVSRGTCAAGEPAVAAAGAGLYLVSWVCTDADGLRSVRAARVTGDPGVPVDGAVLDPLPAQVSHGATPSSPRVAFTGSDFLVVWSDARAGAPGLYVNLVSPSGAVAAASDRLVAAGGGLDHPDVACATGADCLATWGETGKVKTLRLTVDGVPTAPPRVLDIMGTQGKAAVARSGGGYLIAFEDDDGGYPGAIPGVAAVFLGDDDALAFVAGGMTLRDDGLPTFAPAVAAQPGGGIATLAYRVEGGPSLTVLTLFGTTPTLLYRIDQLPGPIDVAGTPAVAISDEGVEVVFSGGAEITAPDVRGAWQGGVPPSSTYRDAIALSRAANSQTEPAASGGYYGTLVAWIDTRDAVPLGWETAIQGRFAGATVTIHQGAGASSQPALAYGGGVWLVAWRDERLGGEGIYAARLVPYDGSALDVLGLPVVVGAASSPAVVSDGATFLVAWIDAPKGGTPEVRVARVDPWAPSPVLDPGGVGVPGGSGQPNSLAAAWNGATLLVWNALAADFTNDVFGALAGADGSVTPRFAISAAASHQLEPSVVPTAGGGFAVAWIDERNGPGGSVYLARVGADGAVLDPDGVALAGTDGAARVRLGALTDRTLAAWLDAAGRVHAVELGAALAPIAEPFDVSTVAGATGLAVGCAYDLCTVVYGRPSADTGTPRVFATSLLNLLNGYPCAAATECKSGSCVDGVCCDSACGGGASSDCLACSRAAGAAQDGFCGPVSRGMVCRPRTGPCDAADLCDGSSPACPADAAAIDGTLCDDLDGCTRSSSCQAGACAGADPVVCAAKACTAGTGVCEPATGTCSYVPAPAGTACDDGNACTPVDACADGTCVGSGTVCPLDPQCSPGTCDPATGRCPDPLPDGTACDADGNRCTGDACRAGVCTAGPAITCAAPDACHDAPACDPATGACGVAPARPDGTACDADGSRCTAGDACRAGVCTAGPAITCAAPDACHGAPACDPATGACGVAPARPDGTACDADGSRCTAGDACRAGVCTAGPAVSCAAPDACHDAPACDPATGACGVAPVKSNGTPCDADGSRCTTGDACSGGVCTAGQAVTCAAPDACHDAPSCDPGTGACGEAPARADGTPCEGGGACRAGACVIAESPPAGGGCGCGAGGDGALALLVLVGIVPLRRRRGS